MQQDSTGEAPAVVGSVGTDEAPPVMDAEAINGAGGEGVCSELSSSSEDQ
jgi:hypothetical protein